MIISRLRGGLGNQMFQYAAGKAETAKRKEKLMLDLSWYRKADRAFGLDAFQIDPTVKKIGRWRSVLAQRLFGATLLDDFYEDKQYATSLGEGLRRELALRDPSPQFAAETAKLGGGTLGIHVRRGDFLKTAGKEALDKGYYERAFAAIARQRAANDLPLPSRIIICSDDKEWCRANLAPAGSFGGIRMEIIDAGLSDAEELVLLSRCNSLIMANSTFSWWAAFLGSASAAGRAVVAPARWHIDPDRNTAMQKALILPEWIVIE